MELKCPFDKPGAKEYNSYLKFSLLNLRPLGGES